MDFDLIKARKFVEKLGQKIGLFLLTHQKKVEIRGYKDRQDVVTNVDLQAEKIIISAIGERYPKHNILSEEKGFIDKKSDYTWYIDPLDGTKEYLRGLPFFSINITLETDKKPLLGVVYIPATKDLFSALDRVGAFANGKKIKASSENRLKNSFIYTHLPNYKISPKKSQTVWYKLAKISRSCYRLRSFQADVISLCWLAMGGLEGFIFPFSEPKWWDISAGFLIVQEAGGKVTDLDGQPIKNRNLTRGIVASNGKIHDQLIKILSNIEKGLT